MDGVENICLWCMEAAGNARVCPHCGHDRERLTSEVQYLQPGTLLHHKRYLIGRVLGAGGFGITYLAYDCQLLTKRAIKEFYPQGLVFRADSVSVQAFSASKDEPFQKGKDSFHKEALVLAKFGTHPNVVRTHDFFEENGTFYLVMDYVEGESFSAYLKAHGEKLSWEETRRILSPIGDVLSTLHKDGLLHRDVKPDNIFITREGNAILLDFGSARYTYSDGKSNSMTAILTPGYAPMEQYGRKHQGSWTDVYAYAATFYRALSGITPPVSTDRMVDEDPLVPLHQLDPNIPAVVSDAVSRAMAARAVDRTKTVAAFLSGFSDSTEPGGGENPPEIQEEPKCCPQCFTALGTDSVCPICGYDARKPHAAGASFLKPGTLVNGQYRVDRVYSHDGLESIYLAREDKTGARIYLVECCLVREEDRALLKLSHEGWEQENARRIDSFHKIAEYLTSCEHRNLMKMVSVFDANNTVYGVMPYREGHTLRQYLDEHDGKISCEEALQILSSVSAGISELHRKRLLHRGIQPKSIFLCSDGTALLWEFDALISMDADEDDYRPIVTGGFSPPEQYAFGMKIGPRTDVYALAATFYRAVSGETPQKAAGRLEHDTVKPLKKLNAQIPEAVSSAVRHALALKPEERTEDVGTFLAEMYRPDPGGQNSSSSKTWLWVVLVILATGILFWHYKDVLLKQPEPVNTTLSIAAAAPTTAPTAKAAPTATATAVPTATPEPLFVPTSTPVKEVSYEVFNEIQGGAYWYRKSNDVSERMGWLWNGTQVELLGEENVTNGKQWVKIKLLTKKDEGWILLSNISGR